MALRLTLVVLLCNIAYGNLLKDDPEILFNQMEEDCQKGITSCVEAGEKLALYVHSLQELVAMYGKESKELEDLQFNGDRLINPLLNIKDEEDVHIFRKDHMNQLVDIHRQAEELMRLLPAEDREQWQRLMEKHGNWEKVDEEL